jgi:hypothetical protein
MSNDSFPTLATERFPLIAEKRDLHVCAREAMGTNSREAATVRDDAIARVTIPPDIPAPSGQAPFRPFRRRGLTIFRPRFELDATAARRMS